MRKKGLIIAVAVIVIFVFLAAAIGKGQKNTGEKASGSQKTDDTNVAVAEIPELSVEETEETPEQTAEEEEPVYFGDAEMTCELPRGFKALDGEEGVYVYRTYPKDSSIINYVITESQEDVTKLTQEEFQKLYEDNLYDAYGDEIQINITQYEKSKINGRNAITVTFDYTLKGTEYEQMELMVYNGAESHILTYLQEKDGKWAEEFKKSIASVAFRE